MADNDTTIVLADNTSRKLRSYDLGTGVFLQAATGIVLETPLRGTNAQHAFTIDASAPGRTLDVSGALATAKFAKIRVFHSVHDPTIPVRCYYVTDGTTPLNTGANAMGYLLHGEQIIVALPALGNFKMIMEVGAAGSFTGYAEFLTWVP